MSLSLKLEFTRMFAENTYKYCFDENWINTISYIFANSIVEQVRFRARLTGVGYDLKVKTVRAKAQTFGFIVLHYLCRFCGIYSVAIPQYAFPTKNNAQKSKRTYAQGLWRKDSMASGKRYQSNHSIRWYLRTSTARSALQAGTKVTQEWKQILRASRII